MLMIVDRNATVGWDAVTGFGTPNLQKMLELSTPAAVKKHLAAGGTFGSTSISNNTRRK